MHALAGWSCREAWDFRKYMIVAAKMPAGCRRASPHLNSNSLSLDTHARTLGDG